MRCFGGERRNLISFNTVFLLSLFSAPLGSRKGLCIVLHRVRLLPTADSAGVDAGGGAPRRINLTARNNGGVVRIDESLLSTLCRSNVIPLTSATTTAATRRGLRVAPSVVLAEESEAGGGGRSEGKGGGGWYCSP